MINGKLIKVCGMRVADNIAEVESLEVDLMGFIFYHKSPRYVFDMPAYLPTKAKRVGVFVNETKEMVRTIADRYGLDYIQLHGNESPAYCKSLQQCGMKVFKAFSVDKPKDLYGVEEYHGLCDYFVFDTKCEQYGGSGNQFDWSLLDEYKGSTPFLLSGGINLYSAKALKEFHHPQLAGYDLNSRFETAPGMKDIGRIQLFLKELQQQD